MVTDNVFFATALLVLKDADTSFSRARARFFSARGGQKMLRLAGVAAALLWLNGSAQVFGEFAAHEGGAAHTMAEVRHTWTQQRTRVLWSVGPGCPRRRVREAVEGRTP